MRRFWIDKRWLGVLCWSVLTSFAQGQATYRYPPVGGIVMASDHQTMILSVTSQAKLVYIDTVAEKELKSVEVDFQPMALAIQGNRLFVTVKGAPKIFVLDADTAKVIREISLPGEPLGRIDCHPTKGLLYAVNLNNEVFSIDTQKGTHQKTSAKGQLLAVDYHQGKYVYTGIQKPIRDVLMVQEIGGNRVKLSLAQANTRALMLKYAVEENELKLVAANDNAAVNGRGMAVSPDGTQVAMAGGGGWRSKTDPRANYAIAVFDTAKMKELKGQVDTGPYPNNIAFHPVLKFGAAFNSKNVMVFNAKSYVTKESFKVTDGSFNHSGYLLFGGRGAKVIYCSFNAPVRKDSVLQIFAIPITPADQEILTKAYPAEKK